MFESIFEEMVMNPNLSHFCRAKPDEAIRLCFPAIKEGIEKRDSFDARFRRQ
jgi:hypothetical protein